MSDYYLSSDNVGVIRERIAELSRIRQDFTTHLGSSLYEVTKDNDELRWGRESLYNGIAACDEERSSLLARIDELEANPAEIETLQENESETVIEVELPAEAQPEIEAEPVVEPEPEPTAEPEPAVDAEPVADLEPVVEAEPVVDPEPVDKPEPVVEPEPTPVVETVFTEPAPSADTTSSIPLEETVVRPLVHAPVERPQGTCPNCGAHVAPGDRFCMECGTALNVVERPAPPAPTLHVCPACGSRVEPTHKFCMVCGHKIN